MAGNFTEVVVASTAAFIVANNESESLEALNERFADALLPLTVTFGVFTLLGFVGNLLILLVFSLSREYRKNNFKVFVLTLGIIDFITCITLIPAEMLKQRHYFAFDDAMSCKVKCFFNVFGASASCLALLVISIDRFRKVVQPLKKQLTPGLVIKILIAVAFVFPIVLAVPGTIMCGIEKSNKTNIYGGKTEVYLCATEDYFRESIWRKIYKYIFILLLVGISITYIILYSIVMKEVTKQLRYISSQRKNSSFEVALSSDFEPNAVTSVSNDSMTDKRHKSLATCPSDSVNLVRENSMKSNGTTVPLGEAKKKKSSRQLSMRSVRSFRSKIPMLQRQNFPSKTFIWFILTVVFIITYITHLILALKVEDIIYMTPHEFSVYSFFYRIYFFNHMINPVVYAIFHKRFRELSRKLIPTIKSRLSELCS